jgi:hypothetical protein
LEYLKVPQAAPLNANLPSFTGKSEAVKAAPAEVSFPNHT